MRMPTLVLALCLVLPAQAAINPAEYQRGAPDQVRLRETARVVQEFQVGDSTHRRTTLVGEIIDEKNADAPRLGRTVVIDYTVDLTARERAGEAHRQANGNRPGPQFMHEPDPPALDADGAFWANLAPSGSPHGSGHRHAGSVLEPEGYTASGTVYVPVSGQYSFDAPGN